MNWDSLIISSKPSKIVKDLLASNQTESKYIGVIPIHWDTLENHKRNKSQDPESESEMDTNLDNEIQTINTTKNKLLVIRNFYYKKNKENKRTENKSKTTKTKETKNKETKNKENKENKETSDDCYYPVYKFPEELPFSLREIKKKIIEWLSDEDFDLNDDNIIDIYRIYKMTGFHLFLVLLNKKVLNNNCNFNSDWVIDSGIEVLDIEDKEVVNPFMKISQSKFNMKKNYNYISSYSSNYIWNRKIIGDIIPYEIKWEEVIATFANLIDTNANKNLNLYFIPNIIQNHNNKYNYNDISNLSKSISEPASDI